MNALTLLSAFLALASPAKAPVTVHVDAKNGDVITGERTFSVTVDSQNLVTQVEFYYNDDLRDKATSTPYQFTVDGLSEAEGDAKLRFKAYTSEGETGEATITVRVDNELGKGEAYHLAQGKSAMQDGKWDAAIVSGRIALKIDSKSNPARLLIARAYQHKSVFDKAQKFAEDVLSNDPKNSDALNLLAVIDLQKAFSTYNRGEGDRNETLKTIGDAIKSAVESSRKALDDAVDSMPAPTDATVIPYVDAALRAGRYALAISTLTPRFAMDNRRVDICDRLAFAQIRDGRLQDALDTILATKRSATLDVYGDATLAVLLAEEGNPKGSDDAIQEAILSDPDNPIVSTSQAYIALKFVRSNIGQTTLSLNYDDLTGKDTPGKIDARNTLTAILRELSRDQGQKSEVNYYLCALNNKLENYDAARHYFEDAVLSQPTNYDAYIEQGNKSITISLRSKMSKDDLTFLYENARTMFTAALTARPSSPAALTGLCLVASFEGKPDEAIKWGTAAVESAKTYAPGHIALSVAYGIGADTEMAIGTATRNQGKQIGNVQEREANEQKARAAEVLSGTYSRSAREEMLTGQTLDPKIKGEVINTPAAVWRYFNVAGRVPVLPPPG